MFELRQFAVASWVLAPQMSELAISTYGGYYHWWAECYLSPMPPSNNSITLTLAGKKGWKLIDWFGWFYLCSLCRSQPPWPALSLDLPVSYYFGGSLRYIPSFGWWWPVILTLHRLEDECQLKSIGLCDSLLIQFNPNVEKKKRILQIQC
jgi:hypothetical protein